jgi:phosphate transport system substrate-binding protein
VKKTASIKILFVLFLLALFSCDSQSFRERKNVIVKGSDTMVNLTLSWAESLMKKDDKIAIQVTGGGSGNGIAAILNGTADVANISRDLKKREIEKAKSLNIEPVLHPVALDGIALIVNPANQVDTLSLQQISDIFSGKIKNWKEVGGADLRIVLYSRENSIGTYEFFKKVILQKDNSKTDFATSTQVLQGTSSLAEAVSLDERGIGYGGVGYFARRNDLKIIYVKSSESAKAISPVVEGKLNYPAIWSGKYPLARFLYCLTNGEPKGTAKDYIEYITSTEGQQIVENMEYIPLPNSIKIEN